MFVVPVSSLQYVELVSMQKWLSAGSSFVPESIASALRLA
jgi:hypothetical protein